MFLIRPHYGNQHPHDKQFCLLIKTLYKNQFVIASPTIYTLKGYGLEITLAKGVCLLKSMSFQYIYGFGIV